MQEFRSHNLNRAFAVVTHAASHAPIGITQHRKQRFVMMSVVHHEAPTADRRQAYPADAVPADVAPWLVPALEALADGGDDAA
jgi:hypothetical protein